MPELKVLIVDDDYVDAHTVSKCINHYYGDKLKEKICLKEEEFNESLTSFQPDIIISDYNMNSFTGADVVRLAKDFNPKILVIVISGELQTEKINEVISYGAAAFLLKSDIGKLPKILDLHI